MRRIVLIVAGLLLAAMLIALPAIGSNGTSGSYQVRGLFDNGSFVVPGRGGPGRRRDRRDGRVGGRLERRRDRQPRRAARTPCPGKAVVVMEIDDSGFKDFRKDASCLIRPQSLIGEKYIDCTPTQPRAPGTPPPPELQTIPDGRARGRPAPAAAREQRQDGRPRPDPEHPAAPFRDRFRLILNDLGAGPRGPRPGPRRGDRPRQSGAARDRPGARDPGPAEPAAREPGLQRRRGAASRWRENRTHITGFFHNAAIAGQATAERSADLEEGLRKFPATLHQVRLTMAKLKQFADQGTPLFTDLNRAAPGLSKATVNLPAFARSGIPGLHQRSATPPRAAGPKLVAGRPAAQRPGRDRQQPRSRSARTSRLAARHLREDEGLPVPDGASSTTRSARSTASTPSGTSSAPTSSSAPASRSPPSSPAAARRSSAPTATAVTTKKKKKKKQEGEGSAKAELRSASPTRRRSTSRTCRT